MRENIPNNFIDLTVTSPPYDDLRKYNGFVFDYQSMLKELYRVTKDKGVVVWIVGDKTDKGSETLTSFKQALYAKEIGFNVHDTMIYHKLNTFGTAGNPAIRYAQAFEYIFVLTKNKIGTFNPIKENCIHANEEIIGASTRKNRQSDGLDFDEKRKIDIKVKDTKIKENIFGYYTGFNKTSKDKIVFNHSAPFPEELAKDMIISYSNEGDKVLDPMCGSGTTCKMAYLNNRKFIGIDMSEQYINDICIPRLEKYGYNKNNNNMERCI
jgi:DNA modification methylase